MGMVRQWQELNHGGRYSESYSDSLPDFVKLAQAYGWTGIRIETADQLDDGIALMLSTRGRCSSTAAWPSWRTAFPMIPSGAAHTEMMLHAGETVGETDEDAKALV